MKFIKLFITLWLLVAVIMASPLQDAKSKGKQTKVANKTTQDKSAVDELIVLLPKKAIARVIERRLCKEPKNANKCKATSEKMAERVVKTYEDFLNQFTYEDKAKICKNITSKNFEKTVDKINTEIRKDMEKKCVFDD